MTELPLSLIEIFVFVIAIAYIPLFLFTIFKIISSTKLNNVKKTIFVCCVILFQIFGIIAFWLYNYSETKSHSLA
jgi:NADH:ubiquinone oxidoreductase subunit 6 (subunit J)